MNLGSNVAFRNGLSVLVDWLSFTLKESVEPTDAFQLLGYSSADFHPLPSGRYGYKSAYVHRMNAGFTVLYDGNDNMGVHVDISGGALDDVLRNYHDKRCVLTPFGDMAYDVDDFASTVFADLLKDICSTGKITRLDLAIDDMGAEHFTMDELQHIFDSGSCVTRFREYRQQKSKSFTGKVTGNTFYLGSRTSMCMVRIYDKKLEQNAKLKKTNEPLIEKDWIRWELELKDDRAVSAANLLCSGMALGDVVIGIISNYIRFIEHDKAKRSLCTTMKKWEDFVSGVVGLKLYRRPELKTIDDKKAWLWYQVAKSITAVVKADGGDMTFLYSLITHGNEIMDNVTEKMIDDYIVRMRLQI